MSDTSVNILPEPTMPVQNGRQLISAYAASVITRVFAICVFVWLLVQAAFLHSSHLFGSGVWFCSLLFLSSSALIAAGIVTANMPKHSAFMQGAGVTLVFLSLIQGANLNLPCPEYAWLMPAMGLLPFLFVAIKRNMQVFAVAGFCCALTTPLIFHLFSSRPLVLFGYYFAISLLLPLITFFKNWRVLNVAVFTYVAIAAIMFVCSGHVAYTLAEVELFFVLQASVFLLTGIVQAKKSSFSIHNFCDFTLTVSLAVLVVVLQMRIVAGHKGYLIAAALFFTALFSASGFWGHKLWGKNSTFESLHFVMAFACACIGLHIALPPLLVLVFVCVFAFVCFVTASFKNIYNLKAAGLVLLLGAAPLYFLFTTMHPVPGALIIAVTALLCAFFQDREKKRQGKRSGLYSWSSPQEFILLAYGVFWWFLGLAMFSFIGMPNSGITFFALSSACACLFYAIGKLVRFRSLREVIFLPLIISVPALVFPFLYQAYIEWPNASLWFSYNYFADIGALAWGAYFACLWTSMYRNWGGLISNKRHADFMGLVTLEVLLVITSSVRALALENGVSTSFLSVLAVMPALIFLIGFSYFIKNNSIYKPYRKVMVTIVPTILFLLLGCWFVFSLGSLGGEAPGGKYIPLLNPVELAQLMCIVAFGYWQRRARKSKIATAHLSSGKLYWIYGLFAFMWLHSMMFRVVQYFSQAHAAEVFAFAELKLIFALLWVVFGIIVWIVASRFASSFSWWCGAVLFFSGTFRFAFISHEIWGKPMTILVTLLGVSLLCVLLWRSPIPFTQRGRKLIEGNL